MADDRLLVVQRIFALPPADKYQLQNLRRHLDDEDKGAGFLEGTEEWIYHTMNEADLTSISSPPDPDLFMKFSRGRAIKLVNKYIVGEDSRQTISVPKLVDNEARTFWINNYSIEVADIVSRILFAFVTTFYVTMAILVLNWVNSFNGRVSVIAVSNLLFSITMAVFAKARAGEIFAVSAGYAAVLVVYASGSAGLQGSAS